MTKLIGLMVLAAAAASGDAGGLAWTVPAEWTVDAPRPMRAATYRIPAAKGDADAGELGVFYFGKGEGGGVDANVQRWLNQFTKPDGSPAAPTAKTKKQTVSGLPVTIVDVKGTFAGGGMMGPSAPKPGYRLLGAIVEGPEGAVFFKFTGPEKTVDGAEKTFRKLLDSLHPAKK